ncbi:MULTISPECIES: pyruvate dehydrogenase complex dihydrolipoamide acetyltransferase [Novosphingobium]|uniref:Acetyltransferase component of pyruvate dehydrogenase complex n=1 Tax=Novosphingobium decolorationis TaxID=2698673 RepID=A0ABX8E0C2_9SPHN|nr:MULTISPECIES: pyruvate dehydrogenase complex dihydrolipoamide acetyltransferase [Novosphingobium]MED5546646.1 pyruvate dehydrogenase complex dihydrolipoamide acetyltransferase [Pseudomonadota bacterium]QVM82575.1 pyruvate dehydrogenase complex dihydrolipoamide acetyltransferase [Novosphingobium decolorationis]GAM06831.1 pyruvate dehydrogenase E2 component [Novosphingobium sp. MBES04]
MPIEIKMPALSPTMEEGKLAKWLVKEGDTVSSGDIMAEIETDKATMEFEAVDEGVIGKIAVPEGTEGVKVGTVIALLAEEGEDASALADADVSAAPASAPAAKEEEAAAPASSAPAPSPSPAPAAAKSDDSRIKASPLARRIAADKGLDLATIKGSGPNGRIVKADVENAEPGKAEAPAAAAAPAPAAAPAVSSAASILDDRVPHTIETLSGMRKTIAKRLTQSKQEAPHIYLSVDVKLDALMALRAQVNETLASRGLKVSVNDMLVKALGMALVEVPECNVSFAGTELIKYERADISVAVSIPNGLITPIVPDANNKSFSQIAKMTKDLGTRAKEGKLKPEEYQGGTASISNMGMMGIKSFSAVVNPPQGMIMAIGAGQKQPWVMEDGSLGVATVMSATGSFDHRAIDGADGARLMAAFKDFVENPLGMIA